MQRNLVSGGSILVEGLNLICDEHTAVDTTRLRRMFTKALVGGIIPYELNEWMPYLPRKALEDVMNILRFRTRYKWNSVCTGEHANNTDAVDEGYAEVEVVI